MRLVVLGVFEQDLVHVGTGILEQLVGVVEDDQGDLAVTQHTQLVGLLHQAKLSLCEGHLRERWGGGEQDRMWGNTKDVVLTVVKSSESYTSTTGWDFFGFDIY